MTLRRPLARITLQGMATATTLGAARSAALGDLDYDAWWLTLRIEGLPMTVPNPPAHGRALRLHDLHHVLTGYDTSLIGECEISAWELAGGSGRYVAALGFDLAGTGLGLLLCPRRTFAAFRRGRRSRTLFKQGYSEDLLARPVDAVRRELRLDASVPPATWADRAGFAVCAALGVGSLLLWPLSVLFIALSCLLPAPREGRRALSA